MIEKIYLHYQVKKNYSRLVETDIIRFSTWDIYINFIGLVASQIKSRYRRII